MAFLKAENLSKSFGGLLILNRISFEVHKGEILGLIGPNGSGKTTLFNLITGFLKPNSGTILFEEKDITNAKSHQVCQAGITRTFQVVKPFPHMTALQNVIVGRMYGRNPARTLGMARAESEKILEMVDIGAKKSQVAHTLTLSDRKRLELARALATRPKLLLIDEMMAGLNLTETEDAIRMIEKIRDSGVTLMVVEHVMRAVFKISDRVIVLNAGIKMAEGVPEAIMRDNEVVEAYLGKAPNA
jgi:branched-chain amino acid transport system ATP-binding protein